jgi:hypothetical protein
VNGGIEIDATSIDACKAVCAANTSCIGIDWNTLHVTGEQCYILLDYVVGTRNNGTATGINHYDIMRNNCTGTGCIESIRLRYRIRNIVLL